MESQTRSPVTPETGQWGSRVGRGTDNWSQTFLTRGSLKYMSLRSSMVNQRFLKPSVCCGSGGWEAVSSLKAFLCPS